MLLNVIEAVYFDNEALKDLHQKCKDILKLFPRQSITIDNAASLDDDDVPNQRSDLIVNRDKLQITATVLKSSGDGLARRKNTCSRSVVNTTFHLRTMSTWMHWQRSWRINFYKIPLQKQLNKRYLF